MNTKAASLLHRIRAAPAKDAEADARTLKHLAENDAAAFSGLHGAVLRDAMACTDLRVRWNYIVVLGLLPLRGKVRAAAVDWLWERLADESPFTRTFAMQALFDLSRDDKALRQRAREVATRFAAQGTAAMRARARKLLDAER